jgi:hypothetical protein
MLAPFRRARSAPLRIAARTRLIPMPVNALVCAGDTANRSESGTGNVVFWLPLFFGILSTHTFCKLLFGDRLPPNLSFRAPGTLHQIANSTP